MMNALLQAYANAWSEIGAKNLASLVNAIEAPDRGTSTKDNVPVAHQSDYHQSVASLSRFGDLQRELLQTGRFLSWMQGTMKMPDSIQGRHAYVELVGPRGMIANENIRFGLYLQQRRVIYPSHWHTAIEDYLVVSGTALWQIDDGDFTSQPPGSHIRHASNQPHATTTLEEPLLAMWFWQGDIRLSTYRIVGVDA